MSNRYCKNAPFAIQIENPAAGPSCHLSKRGSTELLNCEHRGLGLFVFAVEHTSAQIVKLMGDSLRFQGSVDGRFSTADPSLLTVHKNISQTPTEIPLIGTLRQRQCWAVCCALFVQEKNGSCRQLTEAAGLVSRGHQTRGAHTGVAAHRVHAPATVTHAGYGAALVHIWPKQTQGTLVSEVLRL